MWSTVLKWPSVLKRCCAKVLHRAKVMPCYSDPLPKVNMLHIIYQKLKKYEYIDYTFIKFYKICLSNKAILGLKKFYTHVYFSFYFTLLNFTQNFINSWKNFKLTNCWYSGGSMLFVVITCCSPSSIRFEVELFACSFVE